MGGVCAGHWLKHRDATGICAGLQVSFEADGPARMELLCPEDASRDVKRCGDQLGDPVSQLGWLFAGMGMGRASSVWCMLCWTPK